MEQHSAQSRARLLAFLENIRLARKCVAVTNVLAYTIYDRKKSYSPRAKTQNPFTVVIYEWPQIS